MHPLPPVLQPGPGSPTVIIGYLPAWRGIPAAAAAALQAAKKISDTTIQVAESATLAAAGTPGAPAAKAAEEATKAACAAAMGSMISSMAGMADIHLCTTPLPVPPHGPGVVIDGSVTVMINNLPACRMGDTILEAVGPPNKIMKGQMNVIIGDSGSGGGGGGGGGMPGGSGAGPSSPSATEAGPGAGGAGVVQQLEAESKAGGLTYKKSDKGGSTEVAVDDTNQVIYIRTNMEFSGPDATEAYAAAAKKQIEETWSGTTQRNGKPYKVQVTVNTKVNSSGQPTPGYDPIVVDKSVGRMNQTMFGAGPGNQTPEAATDTNRPRRIAHEYGHTLGLDDGYEDSPNGGSVKKDPTKKNDIMSETWPDANGVLPHPHQDHYDEVLKTHGW